MAQPVSINDRYRLSAAIFAACLIVYLLCLTADAGSQRALVIIFAALGFLLIPLSWVRTDFDVNQSARDELSHGFTNVFFFALALFGFIFILNAFYTIRVMEFALFGAAILVVVLSRVFVLKVMSEFLSRRDSDLEAVERDTEARKRTGLSGPLRR